MALGMKTDLPCGKIKIENTRMQNILSIFIFVPVGFDSATGKGC